MAVLREVVIGGVAGHMISAVEAHLVRETRRGAIQHVKDYSHRDPQLEEVSFIKTYDEHDDTERLRINWQPAYWPEQLLKYWSVERVIVLTDTSPNDSWGRTRFVEGVVIVRDDGYAKRVRRFKVELVKGIADNGNVYQFDTSVIPLEEESPLVRELDELATVEA